jgi:hypothetical protein
MADKPTWGGLAQALLVLAVLWWARRPDEGAVRLVMFAAIAAFLVVALCVPEAFGDRGLLFACAYAVAVAAVLGVAVASALRGDPLRGGPRSRAAPDRAPRGSARRLAAQAPDRHVWSARRVQRGHVREPVL